jgi:hypothetical protein
MRRSAKVFTAEEIRKAAQLAGKHAAWEYNDDTGKLKLAKREKIILSALCLIAVYGFAHPAQVLLTTGHWGDLSLLLWLMSFIPGIYFTWMLKPLLGDSGALWAKFVMTALSVGLGFWLGASILFNAIPTFGTSFFTEPRIREVSLRSVNRRHRCDLLCFSASFIHGERRKYGYNIDGQPLPARLYFDQLNGFILFSGRVDERAIVTGQANWFGLRVETIERRENDA